jgi:hypothetical protein
MRSTLRRDFRSQLLSERAASTRHEPTPSEEKLFAAVRCAGDRALARGGYTVLRLDADLVMRDVGAATARIREAIEQTRNDARR